MEFRWVSLIALWTLLSGPIFSPPSGPPRPRERSTAVAQQAKSHAPPAARR
ncbi:MAG: hypothetical protein HYS12_09785 [Planctomycetes bacterium]|nr:hypothetical protein [Planctomycetota bacterium]